MKTELRLVPHSVLPNEKVIEVWFAGRLMATVAGSDNFAGVRVISKHQMMALDRADELFPFVTEVMIDP